MKKPHGADAIKETPDGEIELMLWSSGDEPVYCELSRQQALLLARKLLELATDA